MARRHAAARSVPEQNGGSLLHRARRAAPLARVHVAPSPGATAFRCPRRPPPLRRTESTGNLVPPAQSAAAAQVGIAVPSVPNFCWHGSCRHRAGNRRNDLFRQSAPDRHERGGDAAPGDGVYVRAEDCGGENRQTLRRVGAGGGASGEVQARTEWASGAFERLADRVATAGHG